MTSNNVYSILTLLAIALGPMVAVLTTRYLERRAETDRRKFEIFRSLMQTRGNRMDPLHVASLNVVEVEFFDRPKVRQAYQQYIDHLSAPMPSVEQQSRFFEQRTDLFMELLHEIGDVVGYKFDKRELERRSYTPIGWENDQMLQRRNAQLVNQLLSGERPIPVANFTAQTSPFPAPPDDGD